MVAYDNAAYVQDFSVTTLTTPSFTIAAGAVGLVVLATLAAPGSTSVTLGGSSGSAITGASGNNGAWWLAAYKVLTPASGSQTASATWANSSSAALAVITATGASDISNGNYAQTVTTTVPIAITSNAGDLTSTFVVDTAAGSTHSTDQTIRVSGQLMGADTGPGTAGPITHTWTNTGAFAGNAVGANFVASGGAAATRGTPFGHQGAAFNGGRTFHGIIQRLLHEQGLWLRLRNA